MYEVIIEQIKENCDCLSEKDIESGLVDKSISQLIQLISTLTCWTNRDSTCATFLSSDRQELFDINAIQQCGHCDHGLMDVELFYLPIVPESIKVKVLTRTGIKFEEHILDESLYSFNPYESVLYIDLKDFIFCNPCNCDVVEKVIVDYVAGYEELPECLLPIFCDLLSYLIEMNRCECAKSCDPCTLEPIEEVTLTGYESDEQKTTYDFIRNTITNAYARQLELMSLCGRRRKRFWGTVV